MTIIIKRFGEYEEVIGFSLYVFIYIWNFVYASNWDFPRFSKKISLQQTSYLRRLPKEIQNIGWIILWWLILE